MNKTAHVINASLPLVALVGAVLLYVRGIDSAALALLAFASGHLVPSPIPTRAKPIDEG